MPWQEFGHVVTIKSLSRISISSLMGLSAGMTWDAVRQVLRSYFVSFWELHIWGGTSSHSPPLTCSFVRTGRDAARQTDATSLLSLVQCQVLSRTVESASYFTTSYFGVLVLLIVLIRWWQHTAPLQVTIDSIPSIHCLRPFNLQLESAQ
jgi:hypothetical protein